MQVKCAADLHDSAKALISNDENLMNFAACIQYHGQIISK